VTISDPADGMISRRAAKALTLTDPPLMRDRGADWIIE
jgi:hypothetical protein